jgi:hypothetical protein
MRIERQRLGGARPAQGFGGDGPDAVSAVVARSAAPKAA